MNIKKEIESLENRIANTEDKNDMAIGYVRDILDMAKMLENIIHSEADLEDWVNAKITRSRTDLVDVTKYLQNRPK
jgi:hypothetical protein